MHDRSVALAILATMTIGLPSAGSASEISNSATGRASIEMPAAAAIRGLAAPVSDAATEAATIPGVISGGYFDPRIATNPDAVRRQRGFAAPATVRWRTGARTVAEAAEN
ncbi:hypothetical protein [Methylobacterium sp. OT2]|uniref:hypothetical protein n=1 Tax=Methylobacterium sp. OT2 TaxID=2813779 RepID=UPI00197BAC1D|nr:hypothetical protein [Methylobacterium sp. OT2]MBN4096027.1 hypothetical protein [Methylobacterium sp. OT2]